jgi:hypothetical protein
MWPGVDSSGPSELRIRLPYSSPETPVLLSPPLQLRNKQTERLRNLGKPKNTRTFRQKKSEKNIWRLTQQKKP